MWKGLFSRFRKNTRKAQNTESAKLVKPPDPKKAIIEKLRGWAKTQKTIAVCSFCAKVRVSEIFENKNQEVWADIGLKDANEFDPELPPVSHTYCTKCSKQHYDI